MFRIGPIPQMVGTSVKDWERLDSPALELELTRFGGVVDDKAIVQVPASYEGRIRSDIPLSESPITLAVAINGIIQAVTRTYSETGFLNQWAAMVPETAFHQGKNDVQFYRVTGPYPNCRLTPCIAHQSSKPATAP